MKKIILVAISILVVGLAARHFLFNKAEQKVIIATYNPEITKNQKFDPKDKSLATIWVLQKDGKIRPVIIRKGITDDIYTEIKEVVWGRFEEGDVYITGSMEDMGTSAGSPNLQQAMRGITGSGPR